MLEKLSPKTLNMLDPKKPVLAGEEYISMPVVYDQHFTSVLCSHTCETCLGPLIRERIIETCEKRNIPHGPHDLIVTYGKFTEHSRRVRGFLELEVRSAHLGQVLFRLPWERHFSNLAMVLIRNYE